MDRISFAPTSPDYEMFDKRIPIKNLQPEVNMTHKLLLDIEKYRKARETLRKNRCWLLQV